VAFAAAIAQTPTIEQSLSMRTVSSPKMSPDGRFIAYQVNEANWEENDFVSQIWIVHALGKQDAETLDAHPHELFGERQRRFVSGLVAVVGMITRWTPCFRKAARWSSANPLTP
jgi:hypothetical protein